MELSKQYNHISSEFHLLHTTGTEKARKAFYEQIDFPLAGKQLLDIGCGEGTDFNFYQNRGAVCTGTDASTEMTAIASHHYPGAKLFIADFEHLPFEDSSFDVAVSKYAFQTTEDVGPIFSEANRVLKSGGYFVYLVVHPFRQFIEKKKQEKNYFEKEVVDSVIFNGKMVVKEPTHTMSEYLSSDFFKYFILENIYEGFDFPDSEQIGGDTYPTFLIVKAQKK